MSGLARKRILYSSTKFYNIRPWLNIKSLRRFNLGQWQTSKQIYSKLQGRESVFEEFEVLSCFPWKMISYSSTKFGILELIFHETEDSIEAFDRLQIKFLGNSNIGRKFLKSSELFLAFPTKWICIRQPNLHCKALTQYSITQKIRFRLLRDFRLKQIYGKLQHREKVFREFETLPHFSKKMVLYLLTKFGILKP